MKLTRIALAACMLCILAMPSYATPGKASIAWLPEHFEDGEAVKIDWSMWWGLNGNSWYLTDNQVEVCKGSLTPQGKISQSSSCTTNFTSGQHDLQVSICIDDICSVSPVATFIVSGDTIEDAVPTIAFTALTSDDYIGSTD